MHWKIYKFDIFDDNGNKVDEESLKTVYRSLEYSQREENEEILLDGNTKRYNTFYVGDKTFKDNYDSWMAMRKEEFLLS